MVVVGPELVAVGELRDGEVQRIRSPQPVACAELSRMHELLFAEIQATEVGECTHVVIM